VQEKIKYLEDLSAELAQALGEAVWAFSMIERLTYKYMKALSSEPLHTLMADQTFKARTKLIKHLIERLEGQEDAKTRALRYLDKAKKLASKRNVIAHNPWQIWIDLEAQEFRTEIQKFTDDEKNVDLAEVRKFRDEARETASGFEDALANLEYVHR